MRYINCERRTHLRNLIFIFCCWPLILSAEFRFESKPSADASFGEQENHPAPSFESSKGYSKSDYLSDKKDSGNAAPHQKLKPSTATGWRINRSVSSTPNESVIVLPVSVRPEDEAKSKVQQRGLVESSQNRFLDVGTTTGVKSSDQNMESIESKMHPDSERNISPVGQIPPYAPLEQPKARIADQVSCNNFEFSKGLLKAALARSLAKCGFTIGKWGIGDEEYEYDMEIPKAYRLRANGIVAFLESVEMTYLIRGTRNNLDNTIDFEPSRGAILEGMEIKEW